MHDLKWAVRSTKRRLAAILLLTWIQQADAQNSLEFEEQRLRARQDAEMRARQQQMPEGTQPRAMPTVDPDALELLAEAPCFPLEQITLVGDIPEQFSWVQAWLDRYNGHCLGREGIALIMRRLSASLIAKGYVTTRLALDEQRIDERRLEIRLVPGRIGSIAFSDPGIKTSWRSALPTQPGALLNLRDLEQGLEQFKRLPSQDANIDIQPGELEGASDLVIDLKQGKPWRLSLSLDDAGSRATGKYQGTLALAVDNPLNLNDQVMVNLSGDLWNDRDTKATGGHYLSYAIPWGNWNFTLLDTAWHYRQTIQGSTQRFEYAGQSQTRELRIQHLIQRGQASKTWLQFRTMLRHQNASVDHVDLNTQRRQTTAIEYALIHRHYLGRAQLDINLARREGKPWLGGLSDPAGHQGDQPTWRYRIDTFDASLLVPFSIGDFPMRWNSALRLQHTRDALYATEFIAIANRYTVRGFDGEKTLAAERGGYTRNDLEIPIGNSAQSVYIGLDYGWVSGPSADLLVGRGLLGGTVGMRGNLAINDARLNYDLFAGRALHAPESMSNGKPVLGFQLNVQF